jgi:hypothetical protein
MFPRRPRNLSLALAALLAPALALAPTVARAEALATDPPAERDLALMGTIPIYWGETDDFADLLTGEGHAHWARGAIEQQQYRLRPLDYLSAEALAGYRRLLLAQPRGLSAEENVALDAWVRGGGRLLLFADPMMTGHSDFALGDRRRPQDVALLSPILAHWGLELHFDAAQATGRRIGEILPPDAEAQANAGVPVDLPGRLAPLDEGGNCTLLGEGLAAECRLGGGVALIVADAALLDIEPADEAAMPALLGLMRRIYGESVPG